MEYCSALNQTPFVILPSLGIIYLKGANATLADTKGCHIHPRMANELKSELHSHILEGYDVSLRIIGDVFTFRVVDGDTGDLVVGFSPFVKPWDYFKETTVKIQRFMKAMLWRIRKPTHHLKHIKAFQGSDTAKRLPTEIFSKVAEFYFQPQIHTLATTSIQRSFFGRGHMKIYASLG
jgi:hypothetical protein